MMPFFLKIFGNLITSLVPIFTSYLLGKKTVKNKNMEESLKQIRKSKQITEALTKKKRKKIRKKYTR